MPRLMPPQSDTDRERIIIATALKAMRDSDGWRILSKEMERDGEECWERFIAMPVDKKTNKAAINTQAEYKAARKWIDWVEEQIKLGDDALELEKRRR